MKIDLDKADLKVLDFMFRAAWSSGVQSPELAVGLLAFQEKLRKSQEPDPSPEQVVVPASD